MILDINWTDEWQAIGSIISAFVGIIGFIFLFLQIRQINNTIKSQNHSSIYQIGIELNKLLVENSNLMPYFLGEKLLEDKTEDYYKCMNICESLLDYYEYVYFEKNRIDSELLDYYKSYTKTVFRKNVVMQRFLAENKDTYHKDFVEMLLN